MSKLAITVIVLCLLRDGTPTRILPSDSRHQPLSINQLGSPASRKWDALTRSPRTQALEDAMKPTALTQGKRSRTEIVHASNISDGTAGNGIYIENWSDYEIMVTLSVVQNYYWKRLRPREWHHFTTGRVWMSVNVEAWVPGHSEEPKPWKEVVRGTIFWGGIAWSLFDLGATAAIAAAHGITASIVKEFGNAAGTAFASLVSAVHAGFDPSASFKGVYMNDSFYRILNDGDRFYLTKSMLHHPQG